MGTASMVQSPQAFVSPLRRTVADLTVSATAAGAMITVPSLFIGGTADPVLVFTRTDRAAQVVSGPYQQVMIDGAGHWLQQERPDLVNSTFLEFLKGVEW